MPGPHEVDMDSPNTFTIPGLGSFHLPELSSTETLPSVEPEIIIFDQYTNLSQVLNYLATVDPLPDSVKEGIVNLIPSCIASVFPPVRTIMKKVGILSDRKVLFQLPPPLDRVEIGYNTASGHIVRMAALEALCLVVKPYTAGATNAAYITSRYRAFCASCRIPPVANNVIMLNNEKWLQAIAPKNEFLSLMCIYLEKNTETNAQTLGLLDQVKMVWKGQGMTMSNVMYRFSTESNSKAIISGSILREAAIFTTKYQELEAKLGIYFQYGKLLHHPDMEALNHKTYPNLYKAASQYGERTNMITKNMIRTPGICSSMTTEQLDKLLNEELPPGARSGPAGADPKEYMQAVGLNQDVLIPRREEDVMDKILAAVAAEGRKRQRTE